MPALFFGHGSPLNAIEQNDFSQKLTEYGQKLPRPKAILMISAHWLTRGTMITADSRLRQIYDFYGFPRELYEVKYEVAGQPELAQKIANVSSGKILLNSDWGLDHGGWTILKYLFPKADIPVIQLSLDAGKTEQEHLLLARELSYLRSEGVMIIGSGNIVHNLRLISFDRETEPTDWAVEFDLKTKEHILTGAADKIAGYENVSPEIKRLAVPTNEHYLPLIYIMAQLKKGEQISWIYEGYEHGSISMRSLAIS